MDGWVGGHEDGGMDGQTDMGEWMGMDTWTDG